MINIFKPKPADSWAKWVTYILHIFTTAALILIGLFFSFLILKTIGVLILEYFIIDHSLRYVLEKVFIILLYIEVIASIKIYFNENFHFPLRFFFYIGITDLIRHIIIYNKDSKSVLLSSISILILVSALACHELKNHYLSKKKKEIGQGHFEL